MLLGKNAREKNLYPICHFKRYPRISLKQRIKGKSFWLKVELANINFQKRAHHIFVLVETLNGQSIAQCRGSHGEVV